MPDPASSAAVIAASDTTKKIAMVATIAMPCRTSPTILPNARGRLNGITSIRKTSKRLVHGVGFSNGCAAFALKNPPPLVPSSLIASCEATGPPGTVAVPPVIVDTSWNPARFWMTPPAIRIDRGDDRERQQHPQRAAGEVDPEVADRAAVAAAKPRTSATATAMPTAADTKFCTASPTSCTV